MNPTTKNGLAAWRKAGMGHCTGASIYGDLERPRHALEESRRAGNRFSVIYWRQALTVSVAARRAEAGDRTVARRLAWRECVLRGRQHGRWLLSRYKASDAAFTRVLRETSAGTCAACAQRQERSRRTRDEYLSEIAELPQSVPTYAEYCRRDGHAAEIVGANLDLAGDDEIVSTLLGLARGNRESDFRWLAARRGVPPEHLDFMWRQTLARLQKAEPLRLAAAPAGA